MPVMRNLTIPRELNESHGGCYASVSPLREWISYSPKGLSSR